MRSLTTFPAIFPLLLVTLLGSALGVMIVSIRAFESKETKGKRLELKRQSELGELARRIAMYAHTVHKQFPTGDVVVSERDLAEQLHKRTEMVVTALNLLLNQQKAQRAALPGYWKLNQ